MPSTSTYKPTNIVARPARLPSGGLTPELRALEELGGAPARVSNPFANWAIAMTGLFIVSIIVLMGMMFPIAARHWPGPGSQPTAADQEAMINEVNAELFSRPGVFVLSLIAEVCPIAGLALGLAALRRRGAPLRSWISVMICAPMVLCVVSSIVMRGCGGLFRQ